MGKKKTPKLEIMQIPDKLKQGEDFRWMKDNGTYHKKMNMKSTCMIKQVQNPK